MLIIDCNNLWYAAMAQGEPLNGIARSELLGVLDYYARRSNENIVVVLDGRLPPSAAYRGDDRNGCRRIFAGAKSADEVIGQLVDDSTEPRRVTVVSSDRQLIRQVRKRRVRVIDSQVFARRLESWLNRPTDRGGAEPASKHAGLGGSGRSINQWLLYFDLQVGKSDIMEDERAGSQESAQSEQIREGAFQSARSPDVVAEGPDVQLDRAYQDVQPLKRRKRRRVQHRRRRP